MSSAAAPTTTTLERPVSHRGDALAVGMLVMLVMTIGGRGIGFIRNMVFCRLMSDADVGRWSMAFGFITLITPVMLIGIPGLLPRFTEVYRLRGELSRFVRRIALGTLFCTSIFFVAMTTLPDWFGWFVFSQPEATPLMRSVALAVVGMILYNFASDLCGSLRLVRVVSVMQFSQGVGFTVLSVVCLNAGGSFESVIEMFALSSVLVAIGGFAVLAKHWRTATTVDSATLIESNQLSASSWWSMIRRMAPYAGSIWLMNLLGNLFELSDRTMILHYLSHNASGDASSAMLVGQAAVGQYHSGRMIPMLLLSLATMVSGVLLPYLAADFEAKRIAQVHRRVRDALLMLSIAFTVGSVVVVSLGPWLFETLLQGRYSDGLAILPMALCFCTWSSLVMVGQNYLWTIEKGKWVAAAMLMGLLCNVALNAALLPMLGLRGAVIATLISNGIVMLGVWTAMVRHGYKLDAALVWTSVLPATLLVSPILAAGAAMVAAVQVGLVSRFASVR